MSVTPIYSRCYKCGLVYPLDDPPRTSPYCRTCTNRYNKERYHKNIKASREKAARERANRKPTHCTRCGSPDVTNDYWCRVCRAAYTRDYRKQHPGYAALQHKKTRYRTRQRVIDHYGGKCACCGETRWQFLALDHINGDGGTHRRTHLEEHGTPLKFYRWLKQNGFPPVARVLCHNCNMAVAHHSQCPHQTASAD